jgi:transcriptional regulator EpsA
MGTTGWLAVNAPIFLDNETRDHLVWVIESSLQVRSQSGFFLWSQGALQTLVPHEMLICGVADSSKHGFELRWFASTRRFREEHFQAACDPKDGLIGKLMAEWAKTEAPCFLCPELVDSAMAETLRRYELCNVVAHGVRSNDGGLAGFFCFSHTQLDNSVRSGRVLEMITPFVHITFTRMLVEEARNKTAARRNGAPRSIVLPGETLVTAREVEILHWIKEGKTTQDIATVLELSPFTVKNHVQRILKKLQAKSRSHAIAQAISRGLLRDGS